MSRELINLIIQATGESLFMVSVAALLATVFGLPIGIFLATSRKGELFAAPAVNSILGMVVNATRSTPFIILVVAIIPFTRLIAGTSIGSGAAIVPLTIAATPFIARLVEGAIREVDGGLIETASSFGASPLQIVFKVLIPEALPGLVLALTLAVVSLLGYSAMVGAVGGGGLGDGLHARDVAGEAGHRDSALAAAERLGQPGAGLALGASGAFDLGVGAVAHHGEHAFVAETLERREIGGGSDQRFRIELPVAGMQQVAGLRPDRQRDRLRNGMGHRDRLDIERTDLETAADRHGVDLDGAGDPRFLQPLPDQVGGERRRIDGAAQTGPEMVDGADMILVGMGDHEPHDIVHALLDEGRIGHEGLDFGHVVAREGHAGIDDQPFAGMTIEGHVHADAVAAAEREEDDLIGARHGPTGGSGGGSAGLPGSSCRGDGGRGDQGFPDAEVLGTSDG